MNLFYNKFIAYKLNLYTYINIVSLYKFYLNIINIFIYNFSVNISSLVNIICKRYLLPDT